MTSLISIHPLLRRWMTVRWRCGHVRVEVEVNPPLTYLSSVVARGSAGTTGAGGSSGAGGSALSGETSVALRGGERERKRKRKRREGRRRSQP